MIEDLLAQVEASLNKFYELVLLVVRLVLGLGANVLDQFVIRLQEIELLQEEVLNDQLVFW